MKLLRRKGPNQLAHEAGVKAKNFPRKLVGHPGEAHFREVWNRGRSSRLLGFEIHTTRAPVNVERAEQ